KDESVAQKRFGVSGERGIVYTRTGRRFFDDLALEQEFVSRVYTAFEKAGVMSELNSDWIALDCELMPWSAKAQGLISEQYEPVGVSAIASLSAAMAFLDGIEGAPEGLAVKLENAKKYRTAYEKYCWDVSSIEDYRLAPFHILASEGAVHMERDHEWHMSTIAKACELENILFATPYHVVSIADEVAVAGVVAWWETLVGTGGEGMVVKPFGFTERGPKGLIQPALKVRGPEYLRIIYGPDYLLEANLSRLRKRGIQAKRSLAQREYALGKEGLSRFVEKAALRHVHECVFGVLALESEPVDPRL
ncbi:MAG TPA: hypothetical protein VK171_02970, partial [Fimbriimonas sp.]|nr:hypothetical protein [Fimbriimonas sp.]